MQTYQAVILTDTQSFPKLRPFGAYAIANALRIKGYRVLVINKILTMGSGILDTLLKKFVTEDTLFLGYSSSLFVNYADMQGMSDTEALMYSDLNTSVKAANPNVKIIYGGANSFRPEDYNKKTKNNLGFDYVMHGYSEGMIVDFMDSLANSTKPRFSGVYNKLYTLNFDPTGSTFDFRNSTHTWHDNDFVFDNESLPLEVGRGCVFKCKFCAYPLLGKNKNDNSYIKREDILEHEIRTNYEKHKTLSYYVLDDTFNERTDKIEMMLRIRDRCKLDLQFTGYNRLDLIARKPEQLQLLKDLNFNNFLFGIESLNFASAKSIGKGVPPEELIDTLHKIRDVFDNKLLVHCGFIVGLPHETPETFEKWYALISDASFPTDSIRLAPLIMYKMNSFTDSEFSINYEKYGYVKTGEYGWKNAVWDSEQTVQIANNKHKQLFESGRTHFTGFQAAGLMSLGYTLNDLKSIPANTPHNLKSAHTQLSDRMDKYIKSLQSL